MGQIFRVLPLKASRMPFDKNHHVMTARPIYSLDDVPWTALRLLPVLMNVDMAGQGYLAHKYLALHNNFHLNWYARKVSLLWCSNATSKHVESRSTFIEAPLP